MTSSRVPIILFFWALVTSASVTTASLVLTLDQSNFTQTVSKLDIVLVQFYAPWCGWCTQLFPEFEKAATILSGNDPPITLAKVDATEEKNKALAAEYGLKMYPWLIIIKNGGTIVKDYHGPRDAQGIVDYLKKQAGPASIEIKSIEDGSNVINGYKSVVVGIFPELSGAEFDTFLTVAENLRENYNFSHTLDAKLLPRGDTSVSGPIVRLFKPFDELVVDFEDFNLDALVFFVEDASLPTVTVYDGDPKHEPFIMNFFRHPYAKAVFYVNFSSESFGAFESKYYEIAKARKGKGIVFLISSAEANEDRSYQFYGIKRSDVPVLVIMTDKHKFVKPNIEPDQIEPWLKEYEAGKITPHVPVLEGSNDQPVKVDNFDGKNVRKKLSAILDKVAARDTYVKKDDIIAQPDTREKEL